jgi:hypothetical protein
MMKCVYEILIYENQCRNRLQRNQYPGERDNIKNQQQQVRSVEMVFKPETGDEKENSANQQEKINVKKE